MKRKTILNFISGLCAMLLMANCGGDGDSESDGPTLSVSPSYVTLDAEGSGQTVSVSSNTNWTVQRQDSWINCSPMDGSGGRSITITANKNTGEERYTILKLTDRTGRASAEIRVTQQAGTTPTPTPTISLEVSKNSVSLKAGGGNDSFTIKSNTSWTVSSDQAWCTVSPASGSNDGTVSIRVEENKSTAARSAIITVRYGDKSTTVSVSQAAADVVLTVSPTSLSFTESGGSENISITSNTDWTVSSSQAWCTVSTATGSNNGTATVTADANTSSSSRSAIVTVRSSSGSVTREVTVTQAAKAEETDIGRNDYDSDINLDNK